VEKASIPCWVLGKKKKRKCKIKNGKKQTLAKYKIKNKREETNLREQFFASHESK